MFLSAGCVSKEKTQTEYRPEYKQDSSASANNLAIDYTPKFSMLKKKSLNLRVFDYRKTTVATELADLKTSILDTLKSALITDTKKSRTEWTVTINDVKDNESCIKLKSKLVMYDQSYYIEHEATGCAENSMFYGLSKQVDRKKAYKMALKVLFEGIDSKMDELIESSKSK